MLEDSNQDGRKHRIDRARPDRALEATTRRRPADRTLSGGERRQVQRPPKRRPVVAGRGYRRDDEHGA
jgi:hypothetical protein